MQDLILYIGILLILFFGYLRYKSLEKKYSSKRKKLRDKIKKSMKNE